MEIFFPKQKVDLSDLVRELGDISTNLTIEVKATNRLISVIIVRGFNSTLKPIFTKKGNSKVEQKEAPTVFIYLVQIEVSPLAIGYFLFLLFNMDTCDSLYIYYKRNHIKRILYLKNKGKHWLRGLTKLT